MDFTKDIEESLKVLKQGGLILYPTDTIWGIGCDATNPSAVKKVYQLKKRPDNKSMIVLVTDERDILTYVAHPDPLLFDYLESRPKPTTVIYQGALGLADNLVADDGTIAIRIVKDEFCRHLIRRFRKPVVSTSANLSGEASPKFFDEIPGEIRSGVDYIVSYRQEDRSPKEASSIIRWEKGQPIVIRP